MNHCSIMHLFFSPFIHSQICTTALIQRNACRDPASASQMRVWKERQIRDERLTKQPESLLTIALFCTHGKLQALVSGYLSSIFLPGLVGSFFLTYLIFPSFGFFPSSIYYFSSILSFASSFPSVACSVSINEKWDVAL